MRIDQFFGVRGNRSIGFLRLISSVSLFGCLVLVLSNCNGTERTKDASAPAGKATAGAPTSADGTSAPAKPAAYNRANAIVMPTSLSDAPLKTIDGKELKLSDYAGKVVVLNLWATWCGPCRLETPDLIDLSNEYKDRGVEVIGIATRENEMRSSGIEGVREFVTGYKVPYPMVFADDSFAGPLISIVKGNEVIPQSFIVGRDGKLVAHFRGYNPSLTPPKLRAVIDQAVSESAGS
jgi:thiol-disulfide isomerase/thioredoxin